MTSDRFNRIDKAHAIKIRVRYARGGEGLLLVWPDTEQSIRTVTGKPLRQLDVGDEILVFERRAVVDGVEPYQGQPGTDVT